MIMPKVDLSKLFSSNSGRLVYDNAVKAISDFSMEQDLLNGVLVGLSGGADSVMLLAFLVEYRNKIGKFPILAVHVNHSIRGDEADRDEDFSRSLAGSLGVEFLSFKYDVPSIAKADGKGLEEAARDVRYSCFKNIISSRKDISFVAVAHNSTDNLETVVLNILRGSGSRGASGIPPRRDNILRPLIYSDKELIVSALTECGVDYVTDSTNLSSEYKRNYVRNEILPKLRNICENPEEMFSRFSGNMRQDDQYINGEANIFLSGRDKVTCKELEALPFALFRRVIVKLCGKNISESLLRDLLKQISSNNFRYDVGEGIVLFAERGVIGVDHGTHIFSDFKKVIQMGKNNFPEKYAEITLTKEKLPKSFSNVYKISIQHDLSSAIINGSVYVRSRQDGDTVFYGGITRKIKKLFSDRKIPNGKKDNIPVICDDSGVLCVPGFGVRDDGNRGKGEVLYLTVGIFCDETDDRFYIGTEFKT